MRVRGRWALSWARPAYPQTAVRRGELRPRVPRQPWTQSVVKNDIKAENVTRDPQGQLRLIDLGLAKAQGLPDDPSDHEMPRGRQSCD
ncbi:unnamed protein product [Vitrella brassicaformis CCMP3155]|uniref:Protein kinase domain-containing protein n=1 Tax=Vitrella brassicaformis (strain CCMP3155) TaxID=1169540 RepID=A0A0G4GEF2_VITBC|nr:unnamed protein product [Vitrella brassicaformis CCMP3155]|eukprot:CEM27747.1 unnamed protein product [Vitrella brassicaformis CCMP3155]